MNIRDLAYGVVYDTQFPEDMWGVFADVSDNRLGSEQRPSYLRAGALIGVDHVLMSGFSGRLLRYKRISGDANLDVELDCGMLLMVYSFNSWIVSPESEAISLGSWRW